GLYLVGALFADEVAHRGSGDEELVGRYESARDARDEPLGEYARERRGELQAYLPLLFGGKGVDDAVDGLGGVVGVEGREDEVARLGGGDGGRDSLGRAHLADHQNVDVLAKDRLERRGEIFGIHPHFALLDEGLLVFKQVLDGVFDGHDVLGPLLVDFVDERGERGRFALPHRPHHQEKSLLARGEV